MRRSLPLVVLVLVAPLRAEEPPTVAALVGRLGSPRYAVREAAQKELMKRGETVVPELDRLVKGADAETVERLGKVRYELVGYKDDIRRLLLEAPEYDSNSTAQLHSLVASHQPWAGNYLLPILSDHVHKHRGRALAAFVATWESTQPDQLDAYLRQAVWLRSYPRPKYPAGVGATLTIEPQLYDDPSYWLPARTERRLDFRARSTRYLDGKPYDQPVEHGVPEASVGPVRIGDLPVGRHTVRVVMAFEFAHRGQRRTGEVRSKEWAFQVVSADAADELVAPKSADTTRDVQSRFQLRDAAAGPAAGPADEREKADPWVRWESAPGRWSGLRCPAWEVKSPLQVDLCFEVEIRDEKTGQVYPGEPIVVRSGLTPKGLIAPRDPKAFAAGRAGSVRVQVVLKPSRALALSDIDLHHYYGEPITTGPLAVRVEPSVPGPPR